MNIEESAQGNGATCIQHTPAVMMLILKIGDDCVTTTAVDECSPHTHNTHLAVVLISTTVLGLVIYIRVSGGKYTGVERNIFAKKMNPC